MYFLKALVIHRTVVDKLKNTMAPRNKSNPRINETEVQSNISDIIDTTDLIKIESIGTDHSYKHEILWGHAIFMLFLHVFAIWGLFILISGGMSYKIPLWTMFLYFISIEGVTTGGHRYYTHRSYKATPLLKAIIILCHSISGQKSLYTWCRDHRLHHRYSDTDGDPHNSNRGLFFSHIVWLVCKKHPYIKALGKRTDISDLESDWMVMFQKKYYSYFYLIMGILMPIGVPYFLMGESFKNSFLVCYCLRYALELNATGLVNSIGHFYGTRPYDKNILPTDSWLLAVISLGDGFHNYHHVYPWDYKTAEWSMPFNISAYVIRFLEKIGLAYDLKSASSESVSKRILQSGDGTHYRLGNDEARKAITAIGILHPLNPTYNMSYKPPNAVLKRASFESRE